MDKTASHLLPSITFWVMLAALILLPTVAVAQAAPPPTSHYILEDTLKLFETGAAHWEKVIKDAAMFIFWTLGTISLVYTYGLMIVRKADIGEFFAETVRFMLFFGFFLWLLQNGPSLAYSIVDSLTTLANKAHGFTAATRPSKIIDVGLRMVYNTWDAVSIWDGWAWLGAWMVVLFCLAVLAIIGLNLFILYAASYMVLYAGFFILGFGGSRWTSDMAISYYKNVLSIALKLMTMILLIGMCGSVINQYYNKMHAAGIDLPTIATFFVFCLTFYKLTHTIPDMVAGMVGGGAAAVGSTSGSAITGAMSGAVAGLASAAAGLAGAALAIKAAVGAAGAGGGNAMEAASKGLAEAGGDSGVDSSMFDTGAKQPPPPGKSGGGEGGSSEGGGQSQSASNASSSGDSSSQSASSSGDTSTGSDISSSSGDSSSGGDQSASQSASSGDSGGDAPNTDIGGQGNKGQSSTGGDKSKGGVGGKLAAAGAMAKQALSAENTPTLRKAGRIAGALAKGTKQVAVNAAKAKIAKTTGGQIAAALNASRDAGASQSGGETFRANTLQETKVDRQAEVDAFVNKHKS